MEAVSLIEDSMDKLQQYVQELFDNCDKHFPDLKRRVPKITRRNELTDTERLKNAPQGEVSEDCYNVLHGCERRDLFSFNNSLTIRLTYSWIRLPTEPK